MNWLVIICQAEGETAVLVAGDPERAHMRKVEEDGGIYYHVNLVEAMVSYDTNYAISGTHPPPSFSLLLSKYCLHYAILREHWTLKRELGAGGGGQKNPIANLPYN